MNIEILEKLLDHFSDASLFHDEFETNRWRNVIKEELEKSDHEPVAWLEKSKIGNDFWFLTNEFNQEAETKPLYEHPSEPETEYLHSRISGIKNAVIDCFSNQPIVCDGVLMVRACDYNKLVDAINIATLRRENIND